MGSFATEEDIGITDFVSMNIGVVLCFGANDNFFFFFNDIALREVGLHQFHGFFTMIHWPGSGAGYGDHSTFLISGNITSGGTARSEKTAED
jgi:hypothetical protein|tara:strand:+ start:28476 stop:28751 length:276 start_codon:yes stop_codon:yes gene_type:complete